MLFGLKNAPSVYQRMMNTIIADLTIFAAAYIDDLIIFSESFQDHVKHLRVVFQRLEETGLKLKPEKCVIAGSSSHFLGHIVGEGQIWPLEAKVKVVAEYRCSIKEETNKSIS